jgi:serine/threonine-protein kinase
LIDEAQLATRRHDYAAAAASLAKADPLIEKAHLNDSWLRAYWWLARGLSLSGDLAARQERTQALQKAVALYAQYGPMHSGYAEGLYTLGSDSVNQPDVAEKYFREAIARSEAMPERDDAQLQVIYAALALAQQNRADYDGAEANYAKAADLARHSTGERDYHYWVPVAIHAQMLHQLGDRVRADEMFARLLDLLPAQAEDQQADGVASVRQHWAETLIAEGRPSEAVAPLLQVLERRRAKRAREYDVRRARAALGDAYDQVGRTDDAHSELDAATKEWIERFPADSFFVMQARERWGRFLLDHGDEAGATAQFREVLAQAKDKHFAPIAFAHGGLARIALTHGDVPAALSEAHVAIETFDHPTGLRDVRGGPYLWLIESAALLRSGDAAGARDSAQRALEASRRYDDPSAKSIADAQAALLAAQAR